MRRQELYLINYLSLQLTTKLIPLPNSLEEALSKLDLQGTIVLMAILSQQALMLQQEDIRKKNLSNLSKPKLISI